MITTATEPEVKAVAERLLEPILAEFRDEMSLMRQDLASHSRETQEAIAAMSEAQEATKRVDLRTRGLMNKVLARLAELEKHHV